MPPKDSGTKRLRFQDIIPPKLYDDRPYRVPRFMSFEILFNQLREEERIEKAIQQTTWMSWTRLDARKRLRYKKVANGGGGIYTLFTRSNSSAVVDGEDSMDPRAWLKLRHAVKTVWSEITLHMVEIDDIPTLVFRCTAWNDEVSRKWDISLEGGIFRVRPV